jgi:uncharacterized protein (DUF433 family)
MATVTKKTSAPKTRVTAKQVAAHRASTKRDPSPSWDGAETWSTEQIVSNFRRAMDFYRLESSGKDLKPKVIDWMGRNGYDRTAIAAFKKTKDWRCGITMGSVAACLVKGMPEVHAGFNNGRNTATWLRNEISKVIADGKNDADPVVDVRPSANPITEPPTIQDRLHEASGVMCEELDAAIDSFIMDPNSFDPKAFKVLNLLRGKGAKSAHTRHIKNYFQRVYNELKELASGKADDQLRESYKHLPRKNVKKLIEFYDSIMSACEQIAAEQKILRKPRAAKAKPAEQLVAKLKFLVRDDTLGIVSIPPVQIVGASGVVVYNAKTRKIGYFIAKSSSGLSVKGTSLTEFTEKSTQKTLRKPADQLKEFKEQNTQKKFESWFNNSVSTTETKLTGRFGEDTVILKVYK